jgi:hypothetical protein
MFSMIETFTTNSLNIVSESHVFNLIMRETFVGRFAFCIKTLSLYFLPCWSQNTSNPPNARL